MCKSETFPIKSEHFSIEREGERFHEFHNSQMITRNNKLHIELNVNLRQNNLFYTKKKLNIENVFL